MDYFLVGRETSHALSEEVNIRPRNGWQLSGPTFLGSGKDQFLQPMTRQTKEEQTSDSWKDMIEISSSQRQKNNEGELPKDWDNS